MLTHEFYCNPFSILIQYSNTAPSQVTQYFFEMTNDFLVFFSYNTKRKHTERRLVWAISILLIQSIFSHLSSRISIYALLRVCCGAGWFDETL